MLQFESRIMDISEAPLERLTDVGLSADYVYRDTKRALDGRSWNQDCNLAGH